MVQPPAPPKVLKPKGKRKMPENYYVDQTLDDQKEAVNRAHELSRAII